MAGTALRGIDGNVNTTVEWDPDGVGPNPPLMVVGGEFSVAGGVVANNIACFNPATSKWSALGTGMSESASEYDVPGVLSLVVLDGVLYAGGDFVKASGSVVNHIARWDPETDTWQAVGGGCNNIVFSIITDGDKLFVGGRFTRANGLLVNRVATYDPDASLWSPIGAGFDADCWSLAFANGALYASGDFIATGTDSLAYLARWDAAQSKWTTNNNTFFCDMAVTMFAMNEKLYVYGNFSNVGGVAADTIACYDPSTRIWSAIPDPKPRNLSIPAVFLGKMYVGGYDDTLGSRVYCFDPGPQTWTPLTSDFDPWGGISMVSVFLGKIIAGGRFEYINGVRTHSIAAYDLGTAVWSPLNVGNDGTVTATLVHNGKLYVGGQFSSIGGISAKNVAVYDSASATWSAMGSGAYNGTNGIVRALGVWNNKIYVGGSFTLAGTTSFRNIACWDPTTSSWSTTAKFSQGVTGDTEAYSATVTCICGIGNRLFVGGAFTTAGTSAASNIAYYQVVTTSESWYPVGAGTNNLVSALVTNGTNLYVGGGFTTAGGGNYPYLAVCNPTTSVWSLLTSNKPNQSVTCLAVQGTKLYVGGHFNMLGSSYFGGVANWDFGSGSWINMGYIGGLPRSMMATSTKLYVGGVFDEVGISGTAVEAGNIACWSPAAQAWTSLGDGLSGPIYEGSVFGMAALGNDIWAGGAFTKADDVVSAYLARFSQTTPADCDCDLDVDADDLDIFKACGTGPAVPYNYASLPADCDLTADANHFIPVDFDEDGDVDQEDFGAFQRCFSGSLFSDPSCGK